MAAALLASAIASGLCIHLLLPDATPTDIAGDALYAVASYLVVVILAPRWRSLVTAVIALAWCAAVEIFQLTGLPLRAAALFPPTVLVLGTVFDPRDLVVYAAALVGAAAVDATGRSLLGLSTDASRSHRQGVSPC